MCIFMSCMENLNRLVIPNDIILSLSEIYKFVGKNEEFMKITSSNFNKITEQTIQRDAFFLSKIINLNLTDTRLRLIITKNSSPRNREENVLFNINEVLSDIQLNNKKYNFQSNDQLNMINYIYVNQNIKFDISKDDRKTLNQKSRRIYLDEINDLYNEHISSFEAIITTLNYFIDIYNINAFTSQNKTLNLIILYLLLLKIDMNAFNYISFFELLYNNIDEFNEQILDASYNWSEGINQPLGFIRFIIKIIIQAWERAEKVIKDYEFDQNISKSDNIENTINNLSNIFTKDQIRMIHPYVSESTINRALQKLRDENKIKPLGKGRSAKWIKISIF